MTRNAETETPETMPGPKSSRREARARSRALAKAARKGRNFGIDSKGLRLRRLLAFALLAIPLAALALGAGKFVSMPLVQAWALSAYGAGDYDSTVSRAGWLELGNYFEPYVLPLTQGTAKLKAGDSAAAVPLLTTSLDAWTSGTDLNKPPHAECKIRNNLAIAQGMEAQKLKDPKARADALYEAEKTLAPCQSGGGSSQNNEDKSSTGQTGDQLEEQRRKADSEAGNPERESPGGQGGKNPENDPKRTDEKGKGKEGQKPTPGSEEEKREEELNNRNGDKGNGKDDKGEGKPSDEENTKPW